MGLQDRDWYRDDFNEKYRKYNVDFSLKSKSEPLVRKHRNSSDKQTEYKVDKCIKCGYTSKLIDKQKSLFLDYTWVCPICHTKNRVTSIAYKITAAIVVTYIIKNIIMTLQ